MAKTATRGTRTETNAKFDISSVANKDTTIMTSIIKTKLHWFKNSALAAKYWRTLLFSSDKAKAIPPPKRTKIPQGIRTVSCHLRSGSFGSEGIKKNKNAPRIAMAASVISI